MKLKIIVIISIVALILAIVVNVLSRQVPKLLKGAIERALNKKVLIQSVDYHFPGTFELQGFEIKEKEPFAGEPSFVVDRIWLQVSPMSLSQKKLIIDKIEVQNATIFVRKFKGKLSHPLSETLRQNVAGQFQTSKGLEKTSGRGGLPLEIRELVLKDGHFQWIDYDANPQGFVIVLDEIQAGVKNIFPAFSTGHTSYDVGARMPQGRDQRPAQFHLAGWTAFDTKDTDASFNMDGVFLPYFGPYYAEVTQATIENGYLASHANLHIDRKDLTLNADLEVMELLFQQGVLPSIQMLRQFLAPLHWALQMS